MQSLFNSALRQSNAIRQELTPLADAPSTCSPAKQGELNASIASFSRTIDDYNRLAKQEIVTDKQEKALGRVKNFRVELSDYRELLDRVKREREEALSSQNRAELLGRRPHHATSPENPYANVAHASPFRPSDASSFGASPADATREQHALREQSFMSQSNAQLDEFLERGRNVLSDLGQQREMLKGTQKRLFDAANTLGISGDTIRMVERRAKQDKFIFGGGVVIFFLFCYLVLKLFRGSPTLRAQIPPQTQQQFLVYSLPKVMASDDDSDRGPIRSAINKSPTLTAMKNSGFKAANHHHAAAQSKVPGRVAPDSLGSSSQEKNDMPTIHNGDSTEDEDPVSNVRGETRTGTGFAPVPPSGHQQPSHSNPDGGPSTTLSSADSPEPTSRRTSSGTTSLGRGRKCAIPLGRTWDELHPADQEMVTLRKQGVTWDKVQQRWTALTGVTLGKSSLPNRYGRLRAFLDGFGPSDDALLIATKNEVEDTFEREKWSIIQERVEKRLNRRLPERMCRERFTELMTGDISRAAGKQNTAEEDCDQEEMLDD